jgi:hypothetical protein
MNDMNRKQRIVTLLSDGVERQLNDYLLHEGTDAFYKFASSRSSRWGCIRFAHPVLLEMQKDFGDE